MSFLDSKGHVEQGRIDDGSADVNDVHVEITDHIEVSDESASKSRVCCPAIAYGSTPCISSLPAY
ncbi:hypothetical protein [Mycobacterium sp. 852002-51057_SCH5723018]|uniref:hypothetical protein n=1 Tax=Mycobacterium sp. 852002-51057_SCH5723018 TaxID=1834094 RepID=UPI00080160E8|nr:hypothetical protein [Mycobacterium sp. 852002-51057_SCH5723018]OBG18860.1 hypothetical protein A5764_17690 [Mycobacterium sp. 852002-51057_SCH5723018]